MGSNSGKSVLVRIGAVVGTILVILAIKIAVRATSYFFGVIGLVVLIAACAGIALFMRSRRQSGAIDINSLTPPAYQPGGTFAPGQPGGYPNPQNGYQSEPGYPIQQNYPNQQSYPAQQVTPNQQGYNNFPDPAANPAPINPGYPQQPAYPAQQPGYPVQQNPAAPQGYPAQQGYQQPGYPTPQGYQQ